MNNRHVKITIYWILTIFLLTIHFNGNCQVIDPYAKTDGVNTQHKQSIIDVDNTELNILSGVNAKISQNLKKEIRNYMYTWTRSKGSGPYDFKWMVRASKKVVFEVFGMVSAEGAKITVSCNDKASDYVVAPTGWSRIKLGVIELQKGINHVELKIESNKALKFFSIELIQPDIKEKMINEALQQRVSADWFKNAGYGLMFQWTNRATPKTGNTIKSWEDKVNNFDMDYFINMVERSGAAYVMWSITWGQQYISAPIKSLDKMIVGRTTKRDLLGEMADRLAEKGIKLMFYYHYGYDCYHSTDSAWMKVAGGYEPDKTQLYQNISIIIAEIGKRYGDKLHGWFFDGGHRYYDCHFDESTGGILTAPFKNITAAARTGNSERIIAYNSWILPMLTEYQDYFSGEGFKMYENLDNGKFLNGKNKGLMAHSCFKIEKRWGHIDWNTEIDQPTLTAEKLIKRIQHALENGFPYSINLEMYEDGTVSPQSYELLEKLKKEIRSK